MAGLYLQSQIITDKLMQSRDNRVYIRSPVQQSDPKFRKFRRITKFISSPVTTLWQIKRQHISSPVTFLWQIKRQHISSSVTVLQPDI